MKLKIVIQFSEAKSGKMKKKVSFNGFEEFACYEDAC